MNMNPQNKLMIGHEQEIWRKKGRKILRDYKRTRKSRRKNIICSREEHQRAREKNHKKMKNFYRNQKRHKSRSHLFKTMRQIRIKPQQKEDEAGRKEVSTRRNYKKKDYWKQFQQAKRPKTSKQTVQTNDFFSY